MSTSQPKTPWQYSHMIGHYAYYRTTDQLVFPDGRRLARPDGLHAAALIAVEDLTYNFSSPRPDAGDGYIVHPDQRPISDRAVPRTPQNYYPAPTSGARTLEMSNITAGMANMEVASSSSAPPPQPTGVHAVPPYAFERKGMRFVETGNPKNGVRTVLITAPPEKLIDPKLHDQGVRLHQAMLGVPGDVELLFKSYKIRPAKFFCIGRVFMVLWVEPAGQSNNTLVTNLEPGTSTGQYGERVFSKVRRFVVVREAEKYCSAIPITTYGGQGVAKRGVKKAEHTIIFTGKAPPPALPNEAPGRGEYPMRPDAIRVDQDKPEEKLDSLSRLDFGKVFTVQHNIKARSFGKVTREYVDSLRRQFDLVWRREEGGPLPPRPDPFADVTRLLLAQGWTLEKAQAKIDKSRREAVNLLLATANEEWQQEQKFRKARKATALARAAKAKAAARVDEEDEEEENEEEGEEEGEEEDEEEDEEEEGEDDDDEEDEDDNDRDDEDDD